MSTSDLSGLDADITASSVMQRRWGWLLLLGIVQVICGAFAVLIPFAASLAAAIVVGAVLLVSGVFQTIHAFRATVRRQLVLQALGGILYIVGGALLLMFPLTGLLTLTIVVGALLIVDGAVRCMLAYLLRPQDGWGWFLAAGIAGLAVGLMLLLAWPFSGLWALGILLGANLLISGVTNCALAVTFRTRNAAEAQHERVNNAHRHA